MYSDIKSAAKMIKLYISAHKEKWSFNVTDLENKSEMWPLMGDIREVLGSRKHTDGDEFHEVKRMILANKTDFTLLPIFKLKYVHQVPKIKLQKTIIRTTLYYGCKRRTLNKKSEMVNYYLSFIYHYLLTYLLQLNFHSVAIVLTLVQINSHLKERYWFEKGDQHKKITSRE
jgi:hypothetical protein